MNLLKWLWNDFKKSVIHSERGGVTNIFVDGTTAVASAVNTNFVDSQDLTKHTIASETQGDVLYFDGSNWVRLAVGTSGQFLKTQGASANPVWAGSTSFKVGTFTRNTDDASGDQEITGVGFTPKAVYFQGTQETSDEVSFGIDDLSDVFSTYSNDGVAADTWTDTTTFSLNLAEGVGASYGGKISATSSNSFTITWTKTGSPTGTYTVGYLAFR